MRKIILALLLISTPALAQQPQTIEQRLGAQIGSLVIQTSAQATQIEQLQQQIAAQAAEIKALKDKCEPK